jgi:hypothetical protein
VRLLIKRYEDGPNPVSTDGEFDYWAVPIGIEIFAFASRGLSSCNLQGGIAGALSMGRRYCFQSRYRPDPRKGISLISSAGNGRSKFLGSDSDPRLADLRATRESVAARSQHN